MIVSLNVTKIVMKILVLTLMAKNRLHHGNGIATMLPGIAMVMIAEDMVTAAIMAKMTNIAFTIIVIATAAIMNFMIMKLQMVYLEFRLTNKIKKIMISHKPYTEQM